MAEIRVSPHGSKFIEGVRYLANLLLSDGQRKKIKTFLAKVQRIPVRLLGVEDLIQSQKAEIERLKARLTILDGKFNVVLYGMPRVDEEIRIQPVLNSSLLIHSVLPQGLRIQANPLDLEIISTQAAQSSPLLGNFQGEGPILLLGLDHPELLVQSLKSLKSLGKPELIFCSDSDGDQTAQMKQQLGAVWPALETHSLQTDPITALLALERAERFSLIVCFYRYQRLAPSEQLHFLVEAQQRLKPGGLLWIVVPDLEYPQMVQDLYWLDPKHLRLYSPSLLQETLAGFPGQIEKIKGEKGAVSFLYRKE